MYPFLQRKTERMDKIKRLFSCSIMFYVLLDGITISDVGDKLFLYWLIYFSGCSVMFNVALDYSTCSTVIYNVNNVV